MSFFDALLEELQIAWTPWVALAVIVAGIVFRRTDQRRTRTAYILLGLHVTIVASVAISRAMELSVATDLRVAAIIVGTVVGLTSLGAVIFRGLLPRAGLHPPQILQDVVVAVVAVGAIFFVLSRHGFNLSGIVATSAVLTAVIGLSLQDTLGNIIGGLALQTDDSIRVGDWIKIGDVNGRVTMIRWRYTAIETRNWETVVIPNSVLLKNQVTVLGRREGKPVQWRRWVWFNVDFRTPPPEVIRTVEAALRGAPIANVASDPPPNVIVMDYTESWARYAARYWLTDLAVDDPTDSVVRQRIFFALQRAKIPLSIPAHSVFVTEDTKERRADKAREDEEKRARVIQSIDLFKNLPPEEHDKLSRSLRFAPFTRGEALTRQGASAHWLYAISRGDCEVRVSIGGVERHVATLGTGDIFGEMSLLTGAERAATVIATTDVECWRLDRDVFDDLLRRRPEVAEDVAEILAERQVGLESARDHLTEEATALRKARQKEDLADKIRSFFGLSDASKTR